MSQSAPTPKAAEEMARPSIDRECSGNGCLPSGGSPYTGEFWPAKHFGNCRFAKPKPPAEALKPIHLIEDEVQRMAEIAAQLLARMTPEERRMAETANAARHRPLMIVDSPRMFTDPRDAELSRLRSEIEALKSNVAALDSDYGKLAREYNAALKALAEIRSAAERVVNGNPWTTRAFSQLLDALAATLAKERA